MKDTAYFDSVWSPYEMPNASVTSDIHRSSTRCVRMSVKRTYGITRYKYTSSACDVHSIDSTSD